MHWIPLPIDPMPRVQCSRFSGQQFKVADDNKLTGEYVTRKINVYRDRQIELSSELMTGEGSAVSQNTVDIETRRLKPLMEQNTIRSSLR